MASNLQRGGGGREGDGEGGLVARERKKISSARSYPKYVRTHIHTYTGADRHLGKVHIVHTCCKLPTYLLEVMYAYGIMGTSTPPPPRSQESDRQKAGSRSASFKITT